MPKVLIIEDRRENIVFIANNILKPLGYDVITARDGRLGLIKAEEESPDLIITDLKLPKMGGLEVLEGLHEKGLHIPTIVMTFHGSESTAMRALRLGAIDYLIKPFTVEQMHDALDRALAQRSNGGTHSADSQAKMAQLEEELAQAKTTLAERENQIQQMKSYVANTLKKSQLTEVTRRAEAWEKDNARLNALLAESKEKLDHAEGRVSDLEEVVESQKKELIKYQHETHSLAEELRNLSEAVRLMSQNMAHQVDRLTVITSAEEEGN